MLSKIHQYFLQPPSLYNRIVLLILSSSLIFFVFLAILIFSVSNNYLEKVTSRCGKRVAHLVDKALQSSMMSADHAELEQTIDFLCEGPGIQNISVYNSKGQIRHDVRGEFDHPDSIRSSEFECSACHSSIDTTHWIDAGACVFEKDIANGRNLVIVAPVQNTGGCSTGTCHTHETGQALLGFLAVELPLTEMDTALNQTIVNYFIIVILFIIGFSAVLLVFTRRRIHAPLNRIVEASKEVRRGNMNLRLDVAPSDLWDIRQVERAFNKMLESIASSNRELQKWSIDLEKKVLEKTEDLERSQSEIYQIERLASLGRLSSSVAHEINNPLAGVLTYAKLVSRMLKTSDLSEAKRASILKHLEMIQSETTRCGNIVKGLLNFSRDRSSKFELLHLNSVLEETEHLIKHRFQISNVVLVTDFSASRDNILANGNQIIQACLAVLTNALEASFGDGENQVTYRSYNPDIEHIAIEIKDNGIGIPPEDLDHIFEPFFSRKKEMSGIGLGLAVTYGILEQHGAKVTVESVHGSGTTLKFIFELTDGTVENESEYLNTNR